MKAFGGRCGRRHTSIRPQQFPETWKGLWPVCGKAGRGNVQAEDAAEPAVKLHHTHGGQADVFHAVLVKLRRPKDLPMPGPAVSRSMPLVSLSSPGRSSSPAGRWRGRRYPPS